VTGVRTRTIGRRTFLVGAGHGVLGVAVLGVAACAADDSAASAAGPERSGAAAGLAWSLANRCRPLPEPQDDQPDDARARHHQADGQDDPAG
jgi:hypothetical protein